MAKEKATITVDRAKLERVRLLTGASSASQAIDIALAELIKRERSRRDVAAYLQVPASEDEVALPAHAADWTGLADETDWDAAYAEQPR